MAVPVKPRVSQTARAPWIGLARARGLYAEFSLGGSLGRMCLGETSLLSQRWQRANDVAGLPDPCGATTPSVIPSGSSFRISGPGARARGRVAPQVR